MALKIVDPPNGYPITLAQAKAHIREDSSDFDSQINAFIAAATQYADGPTGFLGRALLEQTWDLYLDRFPCSKWQGTRRVDAIEIPLPPLIDVAGVFYLDGNGDEQEFDASKYTVDTATEPGRVVLKSGGSWPTIQEAANAIRIRFDAGYEDGVPSQIKAAILILVGDLYQNRESSVIGQTVNKVPWAAEQLFRPYRIYLGMA